MTMSTSSPNSGNPQPPREREAQTLAGWLRTVRVSVLYGTAGAGKTELLRTGVLPRLHRRATDVAVPRSPAPPSVIEFPDRRRANGAFGGGRNAEVAVFFDQWSGRPLEQLSAAFHDALGVAVPSGAAARPAEIEPESIVRAIAESPVFDFAVGKTLADRKREGSSSDSGSAPAASAPGRVSLAGSVAALNMQFGVRFLLVLDRFEDCLAAAAGRPEAGDFIDELVLALNRPLLPLNVLLGLRDEAKPLLLEQFERVSGVDEHALQLVPGPAVRPSPPVLRQVPVLQRAGVAPPAVPPQATLPLGAALSDVASPPAIDSKPSPGTTGAPSFGAGLKLPPEAASMPSPEATDWYAELGAIVARVAESARDDAAGPAKPLEAGRPAAGGSSAPAGDVGRAAPAATATGAAVQAPPVPKTAAVPKMATQSVAASKAATLPPAASKAATLSLWRSAIERAADWVSASRSAPAATAPPAAPASTTEPATALDASVSAKTPAARPDRAEASTAAAPSAPPASARSAPIAAPAVADLPEASAPAVEGPAPAAAPTPTPEAISTVVPPTSTVVPPTASLQGRRSVPDAAPTPTSAISVPTPASPPSGTAARAEPSARAGSAGVWRLPVSPPVSSVSSDLPPAPAAGPVSGSPRGAGARRAVAVVPPLAGASSAGRPVVLPARPSAAAVLPAAPPPAGVKSAPVSAAPSRPLSTAVASIASAPAAAPESFAKAPRPKPPAALVWTGAPLLLALLAYALWPKADSPAPALPAPRTEAMPSAAPSDNRVPPPVASTEPSRAEPAPSSGGRAGVEPTGAAAAAAAPTGVDSPRLVAELTRALGSATSPAPAGATPAAPWPPGFVPLAGQSQFAIARYDALQAARRATPGAALTIVTPLYTEELYFIARSDSPLTYIHDMRGAAIDVGPAGGPRAVTAAAIHERLFGAPLQAAPTLMQRGDAALGDLLTGKGPDVVLVVGAQPADWLDGLPPATARALKLLKLDPGNPADQRVLQTYLPATLRGVPTDGAPARTPTLAVMSFLVGRGEAGNPAPTGRAAEALCAALPELRRSGHPKWRELALGQTLPTGWPTAANAAAVLTLCPIGPPR